MEFHIEKDKYHNRFDPAKAWHRLVALAGRRLQHSELNELQEMLMYRDRRLGDALFGTGNIIDGCQPYMLPNKKSVTISPGTVYIDGTILDVKEQTVAITGTGDETIGVRIKYTLITYEDDPTLLNPALNSTTAGMPGMDRQIAEAEWVANDPKAINVYRFKDGQVLTQTAPPELDGMTPILARRTFDESGNYKVNGFSMWTKNLDASTLELTVEPGKAYVMGFERPILVPVKLKLGKALLTRQVLNEQFTFKNGTNLYKLNNKPVRTINRLNATVQVTQNITRGNNTGGSDLLPKSPVIKIVSVSQGATTYAQGTDYQLSNNSVDWSLPSTKEPATGSTYSVTWQYNKLMLLTTDFVLKQQGEDFYIDFSPAGDNPVDNTNVLTDYEFFLYRKDLVCIDKEGQILIIAGQSDTLSEISAPKTSRTDLLPLGTITLFPNSERTLINPFSVTRFSMEDIQKILERIEAIEYNQAVGDLDREAQAGEALSLLKGIFTDNFVTLAKADTTFPGFTVGYDLELGEITLPADDQVMSLELDMEKTTAKVWDEVVTNTVNISEAIISQNNATDSMLVNPYAVFNRLTLTSVEPSVDNWIDKSEIIVEEREVVNTTLRRWWYHRGEPWAEEEKRKWDALGITSEEQKGWDAFDKSSKQTVSDKVLDEAILYMRQKELVITGVGYEPNADNLLGYFDGQPIMLQPEETTKAGTAPGSIRADGKGKFKCSFVIPANTRTGVRLITISNGNNEGNCTYRSEGRKQTIETTVLTKEVHIKPVDPLAQSFSVATDSFVSGVGLYFTAKDVSTGVVVQLRGMSNGLPNTEVHSQTYVEPEQITASVNASIETFVQFEKPVLCRAEEQYCFVVLTHSNVYALGIAELGKPDLVTKQNVAKQPYMVGVLFSSSNALTWSDHQTKDMKFRLYACKFATSSVIEFKDVLMPVNFKADRLLMALDEMILRNTNIVWEVSIDGGSFLPIMPYVEKELSFLANTKVKIRGTLKGTNNLSPVFNFGSANLICFKNFTNALYVNRAFQLSQEYTMVKQVIELATPPGTNAVIKFSTDDGSTWITPVSPTIEEVDGVFKRYTYNHTLSSPANGKVRARIEMSTSNQLVRPRARRFMNIIK